MLNLEIKTEDGWRGLQIAQDTSIEMEHRSWLWDEESAGGFSHSFEIDIDANRELFGNSQEVHGERVRSVLEGKKMRMSVMGVPFLFGIIRLDDEIHIEDGKVDIEFCSENQEFNDLIGDMKCTDVKVKDKICVGTVADRMVIDFNIHYLGAEEKESYHFITPSHIYNSQYYYDENSKLINSTNVSKPYPEAAYCNMRICIQHRKKNEDGSYEETREYEVFEADRPDSGVCFYVLYFLDCLFLQLGISFDNSALRAMEDFCRLAFFTTKCEYDSEINIHKVDYWALFKDFAKLTAYALMQRNDFYIKGINTDWKNPSAIKGKPIGLNKYANSKNFPKEEVGTLIESLKNAFAIRLKFDKNNTSCKAVLMRDVLRDQTVVDIDALVLEEEKSEDNVDGYVLTYGGSEDDTMYNYKDEESLIKFAKYIDIQNGKNKAFDTTTYYDKHTGNMYRFKVDDDAENVKELHPSLFEVGGLQEAWVGRKEGDNTKVNQIGFQPVTSNTIYKLGEEEKAGNARWKITNRPSSFSDDSFEAIFLDKELDMSSQKFEQAYYLTEAYYNNSHVDHDHDLYPHVILKWEDRTNFSAQDRKSYSKWGRANYNLATNILSNKYSLFGDYDAGLALTIMRGPGNEAGVETYDDDYDGEGNAKYQTVSGYYNSCLDSIDQYGNAFDYNGTAEGGVDYSGRFSLKPSAKKRILSISDKQEGDSIVVKTKKDAEFWIRNLLPDTSLESNSGSIMDILRMNIVDSEDLSNAGWDVQDKKYGVYIVGLVSLPGSLETGLGPRYGIINAFNAAGDIISKKDYDDCIASGNHLSTNYKHNRSYLSQFSLYDMPDKPGEEEIEKLFQDIMGLADVYYGFADEYTLTGLEDTPESMYYPIEAAHANRGLLETFHMEQAYFLMNKKILTRKCQMGLAELLRLLENWEHKVRIGDVVGYIYSIKYSLSMDKGVSDVEVVMWYL